MSHIAHCDEISCDQNYCDESPVTRRFVTKRPAFVHASPLFLSLTPECPRFTSIPVPRPRVSTLHLGSCPTPQSVHGSHRFLSHAPECPRLTLVPVPHPRVSAWNIGSRRTQLGKHNRLKSRASLNNNTSTLLIVAACV